MARSPGYLRLATRTTRTLAEKAFDVIREAVVVVDTRPKHLPLVLANAAARDCLDGGYSEPSALIGSSLFGLLGAASASVAQSLLTSVAGGDSSLTRSLTWRLAQGEAAAMTECRLLDSSHDQRLVMMTFAPSAQATDLSYAMDQLPFDLVILDGNLNITYANGSAARSSGTTGSLLGRPAFTVTPTMALAPEIFVRALEGTPFRNQRVELSTAGAPTRWFDIDVQPLKGVSGIVGLTVLSTEVDGPRSAGRPAGPSESHLQALIEDAQDIVTVAAPDGLIKYISGGARNALGYSLDDIRWTSYIYDYVHPDDTAVLRTKYRQLASGLISGFTCQHRVRHQDGSYRWLESSYVAALDNPLINGVVATSRDITERKHAEIQLAQREEVFRLAADAVDGVIFEWDLMRGIVHRSRGVLEILGIEPEDLAPVMDAWRERIHPGDLEAVTRQIGLALIDGRGWTTTYRIRDARGRYRSMLERSLIQRNSFGDPVRAIGCCVDVSEIKRLTDLLEEAQRTAKMGGWEYSYSTLELTWTGEMFRIFETTPAKFIVSWDSMLAQCTPESRERFHTAWRRADLTDGQLDLELEITTLQNRLIWIRVIGHIEKLDGRAVRAFGSVQNIQAEKLAQIALENNTRWLKLSMNMAHMQAWRWDKPSDRIDFAIMDRQKRPVPGAFPTLTALMERVHPKDRAIVTRGIEEGFRSRADTNAEFRLKVDKQGYRSYATTARPLFDADGKPQGFVGVTQDVTARRESQAKLRRSEQLLRTTTANTADTLILVDKELRVRFINRGYAHLSIEEIVGQEISALLPEAARLAVIAKLRHVLATGDSTTYEFESREEGAEPQYFENRAVLVQDDGTGAGLSISVTNITERKRLEQEILEISNRERHAIGRDLHDGLGQELTGVALMLRSLATRFEHQFPEGVATLNEVVGVVNQSIESARSLARGLLPVRNDSGGLPFALRELATRSRDLYGFEVNFRAEIWPEITLSEDSASHLYRIAQEALTNAARHGHAAKVDILLMITRNTFLLRITDDGVGIRQPNRQTTGMGLKIMRYRAGMISAKIEFGANKPQGTVVRVTGEQPARPGALQYGHAIYGGSEYGR
jgi:PAS domain S-box-containing protein